MNPYETTNEQKKKSKIAPHSTKSPETLRFKYQYRIPNPKKKLHKPFYNKPRKKKLIKS